jgi:hypothetical protein
VKVSARFVKGALGHCASRCGIGTITVSTGYGPVLVEEEMKPAIPALLLALGTFASPAAHAESWERYESEVHHCSLDYASNLFALGELDSEDYLRFSGPDKDTYFRVTGISNEEKLTPAEIRAEYVKEKGKADLVYERTKTDFLVLSGYRGNNIFYTKIALSPNNENICVLHISYPRKAKRAFDAVVTRTSRSFAAGN